ncbi:phospholipid methyltransferase [Diplodia corticola]|uniref:Phospholipid methyltransferase n=1 Tax=Diplodia corticola TaxID=236234 RepID=A0A1J9RTW0_9PEZI|nr:phospholipid methyltransferase [Diplodia corticola]OJD31863.1 phospholipid methyltransferase [Diplodia corticola]
MVVAMDGATIKEKLVRTVAPAHLIVLGVYQFILTIIDTVIVQHEPGLLLQLSKLRGRAFSRFWMAYGESMSEVMADDAVALMRSLRGTVLDLGPGTGEQLVRLTPSHLTRVYGAEPAEQFHGRLRANAKKAGLEDKYKVLHAGAQPESLIPALADAGLFQNGSEGIFDEICCIRVLCGVPRPEETIKGLYKLLKPGGRMVVHEHVVNPWRETGGSFVSRVLQTVYAWAGWHLFLGCNIDRDTRAMLLDAGGKGGWSEVELKGLETWSVLPYCTGYLVKSG